LRLCRVHFPIQQVSTTDLLLLQARNDPHVKLMRLNELKFASLSFGAENASRLGSYIYKSGAIVTIKD
jgi:hypothetical protein